MFHYLKGFARNNRQLSSASCRLFKWATDFLFFFIFVRIQYIWHWRKNTRKIAPQRSELPWLKDRSAAKHDISSLKTCSQTRPGCTACCTPQRTTGYTAEESWVQSAKHDIYGLAMVTLRTDRMRWREREFAFIQPSTNFMRKSRPKKVESLSRSPVKHVSTALQKALRTEPFCGIRETTWFSPRKSRNVRWFRTNSSNILYRNSKKCFQYYILCDRQARYLRPWTKKLQTDHKSDFEKGRLT